jgi:hypothetical protein
VKTVTEVRAELDRDPNQHWFDREAVACLLREVDRLTMPRVRFHNVSTDSAGAHRLWSQFKTWADARLGPVIMRELYWEAFLVGYYAEDSFGDGEKRLDRLRKRVKALEERQADLVVQLARAGERLRLAREALVATGCFEPHEVGDDVAPRIAELHHKYTENWEIVNKHSQELRDEVEMYKKGVNAIGEILRSEDVEFGDPP